MHLIVVVLRNILGLLNVVLIIDNFPISAWSSVLEYDGYSNPIPSFLCLLSQIFNPRLTLWLTKLYRLCDVKKLVV